MLEILKANVLIAYQKQAFHAKVHPAMAMRQAAR